MKLIPLTQGKYAMIDDEDFERVNRWKWTYCPRNNGLHGIAMRIQKKRNGPGVKITQKQIKMHRFIIDAQDGLEVDHIDLNPLNNQKSNLRLCTKSQNHMNCGLSSKNISGAKGVNWDTLRNKWLVRITVNRRQKNCGRYNDFNEAVAMYDKMANLHYGQFARTNNSLKT